MSVSSKCRSSVMAAPGARDGKADRAELGAEGGDAAIGDLAHAGGLVAHPFRHLRRLAARVTQLEDRTATLRELPEDLAQIVAELGTLGDRDVRIAQRFEERLI